MDWIVLGMCALGAWTLLSGRLPFFSTLSRQQDRLIGAVLVPFPLVYLLRFVLWRVLGIHDQGIISLIPLLVMLLTILVLMVLRRFSRPAFRDSIRYK